MRTRKSLVCARGQTCLHKPNSMVSLKSARLSISRQKTHNYNRVEFIPPHLIRKYWMAECPLQDFLKSLACSLSSVPRILEAYLRMFTALVLVAWDSDGRFREVFQRVFPDDTRVIPIWTDDYLIFCTEIDTEFDPLHLSSDETESLMSNTYLVSMPVLDISKKSKPFPPNTSLPITSKMEIGKGVYGTVYKIQIAEACLKMEEIGRGVSSNEVCSPYVITLDSCRCAR